MAEDVIIDGVNVAGCEYYASDFDETCRELNGKYNVEVCDFCKCESVDNCYYKQLQRLKQENEALNKKYTEVLSLAKLNADSNEYRIRKLEKENKRLRKATEIDIDKINVSVDAEAYHKMKKALEEIKEAVQRPYNILKGEMLSKYVIDKINEVLGNEKM